jgi:UDP-N-acetylglucosamine 2-epimerase
VVTHPNHAVAADVSLTDSGGIQEEVPTLRLPVVVVVVSERLQNTDLPP